MADLVKPFELAVFHNLPGGGGIKVAGQLISGLSDDFSIGVHCPKGSAGIKVKDCIPVRKWSFPQGRSLRGIGKLVAPVTLLARLRSFSILCREIAKELDARADVLLAFNSMYVAAPPILNFLKIPTVYFCYEFPRHIYESATVSRTQNPLFRFLLAPLRRVEQRMDLSAAVSSSVQVTFSRYMQKKMKEIYGLESLIVRPGVDSVFYCPGEAAEADDYVLSVGALWPFKGHGLAIDVVSGIPAEIRPGLLIVADREYPGYRNQLKGLAARLNVKLTILHGISEENLRNLYRGAAAVICTASMEPYGLVPLEAQACGVPVLAVEEGGFTENVESGKTGLLSRRDPAELSRSLLRLLTDEELRSTIVSGGLDFVRRERSLRTAALALGSVIRSVMAAEPAVEG